MNNLPWMKLPHRQYMVSVTRAALKPVERLAFIELSMFANTQPNRQLPDLDDALAGWAGMGVKQWAKIKARVFAEWSLNNGYWSLPTWFDLYDDAPKANVTPVATTKRSASAERVARMRQRNRNTVTPNVTPDVTPQSVTCNADVTLNVTPVTVTSVTNGGIKGGDLDQDLDLDQEVKNTQTNVRVHVRENFSPKLEDLNARLKMAGGTAIDQKTLDQTLVTFVPHYETQFLTDNQLLGKLVQWVKRDQDKPKFAPAKTQKTKQVHGNVNADWGNPPPPDLSVPYILDAESIAIRQELPF